MGWLHAPAGDLLGAEADGAEIADDGWQRQLDTTNCSGRACQGRCESKWPGSTSTRPWVSFCCDLAPRLPATIACQGRKDGKASEVELLQLPPHNLACRGLGQIRHEGHRARHFIGGQVLFAESQNVVLGRPCATFQHHIGARQFSL